LVDLRVRLAREGHLDQAVTIQVGEGRQLMAAALAVRDELIQTERAQVIGRGRQADRNDLAGFFVVLGLSALSILGLAVMMGSMARANRRLQHEIGERQAAEAARRDGEALYRAIFETTADLLYVLEVLPDGRFNILEGNPAYERAVGVLTETFRGLDVCSLVNDDQRPILLAHLNAVVEARQPVFSRDRVLLPVGERIWESVLTPLRNADGRVERIAGASRDVTDREHAQEQVRRVQRMETIGHLTGGLAHDFNNLLQVIRGNLELISAQIGDSPASGRIQNALSAAERAAQLTRQLLAFAWPIPPNSNPPY
jgi:PAS domain S-box-containing protein